MTLMIHHLHGLGPGRALPVTRGSRPVCWLRICPGLGWFFAITIEGMVNNFSFFWLPQLPAMGW